MAEQLKFRADEFGVGQPVDQKPAGSQDGQLKHMAAEFGVGQRDTDPTSLVSKIAPGSRPLSPMYQEGILKFRADEMGVTQQSADSKPVQNEGKLKFRTDEMK